MTVHSFGKALADRDAPAFIPSGARNVPRTIFAIIDEDGVPIYTALDASSCHSHINFVINDSGDGTHIARHWVVRRYSLGEQA